MNYYPHKEIKVFGSVGLSFCLSVTNITLKVMNRLRWNFKKGWRVVKEQVIKFWWRSRFLTTQSGIHPLLNKLERSLLKIFRIALQCYKDQFIKFLGWSGLHAGAPNRNSGQYGGIEPPCWRSVLSECSCLSCFWATMFLIYYYISALLTVSAFHHSLYFCNTYYVSGSGFQPASSTPGIHSIGIWRTPSLKHESPACTFFTSSRFFSTSFFTSWVYQSRKNVLLFSGHPVVTNEPFLYRL